MRERERERERHALPGRIAGPLDFAPGEWRRLFVPVSEPAVTDEIVLTLSSSCAVVTAVVVVGVITLALLIKWLGL